MRENEFIEFEKQDTEQSIPTRFEQQVCRYPQRRAVKTRRHELSYEALNQAANRIAHVLLAQRGDGAEPIALLLEHDAPLIAALLGVLKAGKSYVPLDPAYPRGRVVSMLEDCRAGLIVTQSELFPMARELAQNSVALLNLDEIASGTAVVNPGLAIAPDAFAYLLYTSGSTGTPKGVIENHRNVLHFTMVNTNSCHFCADDRLTLFASCSFSASATPIFGALLNGAALVPFDINAEGVAPVAEWLRQEGITVFHGGSVFRHFVRSLVGREEFPQLRLIYWGGEPLTRKDVELYRTYFSRDCVLVNALGAAEMKCFCQYFIDHETPIDRGAVPVGYPVEDVEVLLLDEAGQAVGFDATGEIAVKTRYLAPGYWRRPELTREKFLPGARGEDERIYRTGDLGRMRADGCLFHLGRKDTQVKLRGYTVELAAIEAALLEQPGIQEAAVLLQENDTDTSRLVAYVVPAGKPMPGVNTLRQSLAQTLPEYMLPSAYVLLDALPRNANGKVDRLSLPKPGGERPALETPFVAPRTPIEEMLVKIWGEVLGLELIGIQDDFLELGGESLRAAQVRSRVQEAFQVELPVRRLFEARTVAEMATAIAQSLAGGLEEEAMLRALSELEQLPAGEAARRAASDWLQRGTVNDQVTFTGDNSRVSREER